MWFCSHDFRESIFQSEIPAAFLQGDIFNSNWIREPAMEYLNYASLGFILGHEMTHGFDTLERQFDADGNWVDWWTNETEKIFQDKTECLVNQYNNYTDPISGLHLNGSNTLPENIADHGEHSFQSNESMN